MRAAERRRGIALALDHRPELDLVELQRLLARAGVEVDARTLVEDLDALGYDVDDDELEEHGVALDGEPAEPLAAPVAFAADDHDEEPHDAGRPRGRRRTGAWIVLAAAAVVLVAIVAIVLVTDGDGGTDDLTGLPPDTVVVDSGGETIPETTAPAPAQIAPEGPGSDPALEVPETLTDDFERVDVGDFPGVATWELLSGEWANTDGNLDVISVPDDGLAVAALDVGSADVRAQVQVDRPATRAGIAFRIVDEANLFLWAPVPEIGSIILYEVVDGVATPVADSGFTEAGDGMPALGINLVGGRAELLRDGVVVATYEGLAPDDEATRIGVAVLDGGEGLPLFDELRVLTP